MCWRTALSTAVAVAAVAACGSSATTSQTETTALANTPTTASALSSSASATTSVVGTAAVLGLGAPAVQVGMTGDATDPAGARFVPSAVTVHVGDIVEWDYSATAFVPHNVIFPATPNLSSGVLGAKANGDPGLSTWQVKFTAPGTYHYQCNFHLPGQVGTVTVTG
jgi:plastocyanin